MNLFDAFISHANEDKDDFVRLLAHKLKENHIEVWYDEFSLKAGDSLRRSIDKGLSKSRFGIVILSKWFFQKEWTQWELDGLIQKQHDKKNNIILPIWHNISKSEILDYSPSLVDSFAIQSSRGMEYVVEELLKVLKPNGSTLIYARDHLINLGYTPPVVTDDWWLDVVEYYGRDHLETWEYSIFRESENAKHRGKTIAETVIQMEWLRIVEENNLSQITHPDKLLKLINSLPGYEEMCLKNLERLTLFAPQLVIKGFGGNFEDAFEEYYQKSLLNRKNNQGGTGLTINGKVPLCEEEIALRDPFFGYYKPSFITCHFVQGPLMGPSPKVYDHIDYLVWFLSDDSKWLPEKIRRFLLDGFKEWEVWPWTDIPGQRNNNDDKKLFSYLFDATRNSNKFKLTQDALDDIHARFSYTKKTLFLKDNVDDLIKSFLEEDFIGAYIKEMKKRNKKTSQREKEG